MNDPQSDRQQLPTLSLPSALPLPPVRQPPTSSTLGCLDAALERLFAQPRGESSPMAGVTVLPPVDQRRIEDSAGIIADDSSASFAAQAAIERGSGELRQSDVSCNEKCIETGSGSQGDLKETAASDTATSPSESAAAHRPATQNADSAAGDPAASHGESAERRAFPRRDSGSTVSIHRPKDQEAMSGQEASWLHHASRLKGSLLDVSMSGAALRMAEPLDHGEVILLRLSNRRFDVSVDRKATVLRCSPHGDGSWKIVCKYDSNLTFEQVDVLGQGLFNSRLV